MKFSFRVASLFVALFGVNSVAVPFVYQCRVTEYTQEEPLVTTFEFAPKSSAHMDFETKLSHVGLQIIQGGAFSISLRSLANPNNYTRVTGYDIPKRMSAILANIEPEYTAQVECIL